MDPKISSKQTLRLILVTLMIPLLAFSLYPASGFSENDPVKLENPISVGYLKKKFKKIRPKIGTHAGIRKTAEEETKIRPTDC